MEKVGSDPVSNLPECNSKLRRLDARGRIFYLAELTKGDMILSTSFGQTSAVLLHLVTSVIADIQVVNVQNGHETAATGAARDILTSALGLNLTVIQAPTLDVPDSDSDQFATFQRASKSEPFERFLKERRPALWLSGVRRDETELRVDFDYLMETPLSLAAHPILDWTLHQCRDYCDRFGLLINDFHYDPTKGADQQLECGLHVGKNPRFSRSSNED